MTRYALAHLTDSALLHDLLTLVSQDRATTALLIAHLGETDARRLYAPAGYPSMFEYCVKSLGFSEDMAFKRIQIARLARRFPIVHDMLADGRSNLSALLALSAHLTPDNADDLLAAAAGRTRSGIEQLIAERFPRPDLPTLIAPVTQPMSPVGLAPGRVIFTSPEHAFSATGELEMSSHVTAGPESVGSVAAGTAPANSFPSPATVMHKVAPLSPERYAIQCTVSGETHAKLRYAQELLGHAVPSGDLAQVLDRALDALIAKLEHDKFAQTDRPRPCRRSDDARHVPASVKRAVWERDGGCCTFVGENGHRCESRTRLEFDHVEPVATGGHATVAGLRLRCRAHNQYAAERAFGRDFMNAKRGRDARLELPEHALEVIPWLRHLGMRPEEARRYAACCSDMPEATLEDRLRHALRCSARSSPQRVA
jgi:hypothetical protein